MGSRWSPVILAALIVPLVLVPAFPEFMYHWDEFQLSYGVEHFDLATHTPHPPGYFLFVMLGRLVRPLVGGDATLALRVLAVLATMSFAGLVAGALPERLGLPERLLLAAGAGSFFVLSPLVFSFGMAALTYTTEGAVLTGLLLAIAARPEGRWRWLLVFCIGLAGGFRQTLVIWGTVIMLVEMLRHRDWVALRDLPALVGFGALGLATWVVPLMVGVGGLARYRELSAAITSGNIWAKSVFVEGVQKVWLARVPLMAGDLWLGAGIFGLLAVGILVARVLLRDDRLARLDPLLSGAVLAFLFYLVLIYDTAGYMIACLMPVAAYGILGMASLLAIGLERGEERDEPVGPATRLAAAALPLVFAGLFPVLPRGEVPGGTLYGVYANHDAEARARVDAVRETFEPRDTVLITSEEYWEWGLRHVGHDLPEFTTLQLVRDDFFAITTDETPYLTTSGRELWTTGPDGLDLAALVEGGPLAHVVYMVPYDVQQYIHPSCIPVVGALHVREGEMLAVIDLSPGVEVHVVNQQLACVLPRDRRPPRPTIYRRGG